MLISRAAPKTKSDLLTAIQQASIRRISIFEDAEIRKLPSSNELQRKRASVIVLEG